MQPGNTIPSEWRADSPRYLTTEELAALLRVRANTIRSGVCRDGADMGIRPIKRANRMLAWPADQAEAVARGEVAA